MVKLSRKVRPGRRFLAATVVLLMTLGVPAVTAAGAQIDELPAGARLLRERANGDMLFESGSFRYAYDNSLTAGDYAVIHGGDVYDECLQREAPPIKSLVRPQQSGLWTVKTLPAGLTAYTTVYKTDLSVFDFVDEVCGRYLEDGTPMPAPFAVGMSTLSRRETSLEDWRPALDPNADLQPGRYRNGVSGLVADADGNAFVVETIARYSVLGDGSLDLAEVAVSLTPA